MLEGTFSGLPPIFFTPSNPIVLDLVKPKFP